MPLHNAVTTDVTKFCIEKASPPQDTKQHAQEEDGSRGRHSLHALHTLHALRGTR